MNRAKGSPYKRMDLSGIKSGQLPVFMENYHDSYAKAMAKYGL